MVVAAHRAASTDPDSSTFLFQPEAQTPPKSSAISRTLHLITFHAYRLHLSKSSTHPSTEINDNRSRRPSCARCKSLAISQNSLGHTVLHILTPAPSLIFCPCTTWTNHPSHSLLPVHIHGSSITQILPCPHTWSHWTAPPHCWTVHHKTQTWVTALKVLLALILAVSVLFFRCTRPQIRLKSTHSTNRKPQKRYFGVVFLLPPVTWGCWGCLSLINTCSPCSSSRIRLPVLQMSRIHDVSMCEPSCCKSSYQQQNMRLCHTWCNTDHLTFPHFPHGCRTIWRIFSLSLSLWSVWSDRWNSVHCRVRHLVRRKIWKMGNKLGIDVFNNNGWRTEGHWYSTKRLRVCRIWSHCSWLKQWHWWVGGGRYQGVPSGPRLVQGRWSE